MTSLRFKKSPDQVRAPRLLLTMPGGIGDAVAIGLCAVDQIIQNDPDGRVAIDILCNQLQADLFRCDPRLHSVIIADDDLFSAAEEETRKRGIFLSPATAKLEKYLHEQCYTAVMPFLWDPGLFCRLRAPLLFPDIQQAWQIVLAVRSAQDMSIQTMVRQSVNKFFKNNSRPSEDEPIPLYLCPDHIYKARHYMELWQERAGIPQEHLMVLLVAPDTSTIVTRPPTSLLAQGIASALQSDLNLFVMILPGYTDTQAAGNLWSVLSQAFPELVLLLPEQPQLSLLELAALIDQSDIFVTGDTGTMHLAAAVKTLSCVTNQELVPRNMVKIIALFGGTNPGLFGYTRRTIILGRGRKEQTAFTPGMVKDIYHPRGKNLFDHIAPHQLASAIIH